MCFSMIPQAGMTSEANMSPRADTIILQADMVSQADIALQAGTRNWRTHPRVYVRIHESTGGHDFRSEHEFTG